MDVNFSNCLEIKAKLNRRFRIACSFIFLNFLAGLCVIWKCSGKEKKGGVGNSLALCFFFRRLRNSLSLILSCSFLLLSCY